MKVLELCETCANTGNGKIRIININNSKDRAEFNSINELEKTPIKNFEVSAWQFIPHEQIGAMDWYFTLVIIVR